MPEDTEDRPGPFEGTGPSAWDDDVLPDPLSSSVFSQELAGIDESDWAIDSALIWGDDVTGAGGPLSGMPPGPDLIG